MTFAEYVAWWREHAAQRSSETDTAAQQLLYLKDWHFVAQQPDYKVRCQLLVWLLFHHNTWQVVLISVVHVIVLMYGLNMPWIIDCKLSPGSMHVGAHCRHTSCPSTFKKTG